MLSSHEVAQEDGFSNNNHVGSVRARNTGLKTFLAVNIIVKTGLEAAGKKATQG